MSSLSASAPVIVKVGGSLFETGRLGETLAIIAHASVPLVVVPGGGPFADAVRRAQSRSRISDAKAHRLAIMGMHQMAEVLLRLHPRLVKADTFARMHGAWEASKIPVWLPLRLAGRDTSIPQDWSITSDGLAARLAERMGARMLVLVKSRTVSGSLSARALADEGIADPEFANIVERARLTWRIVGPGEEAALAKLVGAPPAGTMSRRS